AAAEMDLDVIPVGEMADDGAVAFAIVALEGVERLVGEHDAEAEGIVGAIALEHDDPRLWPFALHQDREIEAGRPTADDLNFHARLPLVSRFRSSHHCAAPLFASFGIEGH